VNAEQKAAHDATVVAVVGRLERDVNFWQGVACGLAVAIAILLTVIVRLM